MKKIFLILTLFAAICGNVSAVVTQKIFLKNGSVLNGFIQQQDTLGNLTVRTDSATICLSKELFNVSDDTGKVNVNGFAHENKGKDSISSRFLNHLSRKQFGNVRIIEKGVVLKFVDLTVNEYAISWEDVVSITAEKRPANLLSGIKRRYYLKSSREVEGEYAGETQNTISLYQKDIIETINFSEVNRYTISKLNQEQEIFEQTPLLDVVQKKRGESIQGLIVEQNYSNEKDEDNYITIMRRGEMPQVVKISEIKSISKECNIDYKPIYDTILGKGEILINRKPVEYVNIVEKKVKKEELLALDSLSYKVQIPRGNDGKTKLTIEYRDDDSVSVDEFKLVKVTKMEIKSQIVYAFKYKDVVASPFSAQGMGTSMNKTRTLEYEVAEKGVYVLYDAKRRRAIPIIVKE